MRKYACVLLAAAALLPIAARAQIVDTFWVRQFASGDSIDYWLSSIVADTSGNVYATGVGSRHATNDDFWTMAVNKWGKMLWNAYYDGGSDMKDSAAQIVMDHRHNLYVVGTAYVNDTQSIVVVKYDTSGNQIWASPVHFPGDPNDVATGIAVSDSGYLYACGTRQTDTTNLDFDYITIRYNPANGETIWTRDWHRTGEPGDDVATALAADHKGNVAVTGYNNTQDFYYDYGTVKYDTAGNEKWERYYNNSRSSGNGDDVPSAIAVDQKNDVVVTGSSEDDNTGLDYATIEYDSIGDTLWTRRYNSVPANDNDVATAIAVDDSNNVCVTGYSTNNDTGYYDYATLRYNPSGTQLWIARYDAFGDDNIPAGMTTDQNMNVYVTGYAFNDSADDNVALTLKYNPVTGLPIWTNLYWGFNNDVAGQGVAVAPGGLIYVGDQVMYSPSGHIEYGLLRLYEPTYDCGASDVIAPVESVGVDSSFNPRILIHNYGIYADTVQFKITVGSTYRDSITMYLSADTAETLAFRPAAESMIGAYAVRCTTIEARDINPFNNVASDSFHVKVYVGIDNVLKPIVVHPFLQVAPNPASNLALIKYAVREPEKLDLKIYDATGRMVRNLSTRSGPMTNAVSLNLHNLASGVYLVRLVTPSFRSVNKLVIDK